MLLFTQPDVSYHQGQTFLTVGVWAH